MRKREQEIKYPFAIRKKKLKQSSETKGAPMDAQNENSGSNGCFQKSSSSQRKPGGWKTMPYILGNETFERLASTGLLANFMVYLRKVYHFNQVAATSLINIWSIANNFTPLIGAFISDAYLGRFYTIAIGSFVSILGMVGMTLTAWIPQLHPPKCDSPLQATSQCKGPTASQIGFLIMSLCFLSIGSGGIRPCSVPFGVDQFDTTTEKGRKGLGSFYNWYYATFSIILVFTATVVVYIQDSVSWVLGYGIPTLLMFCAIVLFFRGSRVYVYMKPDGSVFTALAQVVVAAFKKRKLKLPSGGAIDNTTFYDPPFDSGTPVISKLPLTTQYRFLNKAAIVVENELNQDGARAKKWSLCSIQQVEELKCIVRVLPIWGSTIFCLLTIIQQGTFSVSQALQMDRQLGPNFKVPAASIGVTSYLTLAIWIPLYDRVIVPQLRKVTNHPNGITQLQRIGIGSVFAVMAMAVAGIVEKKRRDMANEHHRVQMSVFWLAPQHILMGLCEAFSIIGQMEFFNNEFPEHLRTMANALLSISFTIATYVSTLVVIILHKTTGGGGSHGKPDWLTNDLNAGRLDYYYYIVAGIAFLNLFLFVYCASKYQYKGNGEILRMAAAEPMDEEVELTSDKNLVV